MFDHVSKKRKGKGRRETPNVARVRHRNPRAPLDSVGQVGGGVATVGAVRIFKDGTAPFHIAHEPATGR